ncbi:MAG TPA: SDR family NAD(P)-dependent oxidoreductase [Solirubrobacteraceae bacterium]|nr:SDR family NAD(P)-dependent oxidoreductase [Solirubrobacteraceae bacterium]
MNGSRVIVTGATSGIGKEIALQLASRGAQVILACRDVKRGKQTSAEIRNHGAPAEPAILTLDASSRSSIKEFAREFGRRYDRLDVLVNNAGVLSPQRITSVDGVELTLATNVIGYYLMTRELLDVLRGSAPARVVNVASTFAGDLDLDDLQFAGRSYDGMRAYAQSKACDRMVTWAFARRLADADVTVNAMAPGLVTETNLYDDLADDVRHQLRQQPSRSVAEGADTAVWLAAATDVEGVSGKFYEQRAERPCQFRDLDAEEKLWALCQAIPD